MIFAQITYFRPVNYMYKIGSAQVFISQCTKYKINKRSSCFDIWMIHHTRRLKLGKYKFFYKLFQWYTILEAYRNSYGKAVHKAAQCRTFFCEINKYFTEGSVGIFTSAQENYLAAYFCLLSKSSAFGG